MKKVIILLLLPFAIYAQPVPFSSYKSYNFPTELCSAAQGAKIAWALDEQGKRNVYVAEGPDYKPRKITSFNKDDGQEITSLSISNDGKWVVFARGGDHGGNWGISVAINPSFELNAFKIQIASVPFAGGETKFLSEGDYPVMSPDNRTIAFLKGDQIWTIAADGTTIANNLFTTKGKIDYYQWSPDGSSIAFTTNRGDHSIIGIYSKDSNELKWMAPSFNHDQIPQWSTDGNKIVFIRTAGSGGEPDLLLPKKIVAWNIFIADVHSGTASLLYKSPFTHRGSYPTTHGGTNLHWAADNNIVFLSYQDGWPHLYTIPATGGKVQLLTPGNFMCEHIVLSSDKKLLTFSANTGSSKLDIERRHIAEVSVNTPDMKMLTNGEGIEWSPVVTGNSKDVAFLSASSDHGPLTMVQSLNDVNRKIEIAAGPAPTAFSQASMVVPKAVIFKASDGKEVHADLFLPKDLKGKKGAIVYVHGGPPRQMLLGWNYSDYYSNAYASNQYLASLGFVVLAVNYRLGIGYGYEYHQPEHAGMAGAVEYLDIKAAGEWLKSQTYVDAHKIGIYGGSYGGYLTALALARDSKLFSAGVDIHGVNDWAANASVFVAAEEKYQRPSDYEKALQTAWESSPVSSMDKWTSPVLIIHGDDDRNVHFNQSVDLINRLDKKKIPYETLMIVDDTHHWMKWQNAVTVYNAVAEFFLKKF